MTPRNREIVSRACKGMRPHLIADELGIPRSTVYSAIATARRFGYDIPRFSTGAPGLTGASHVAIESPLVSALSHAAAARGYPSASSLACALLRAVIKDDLFDAVLDDREPPQ